MRIVGLDQALRKSGAALIDGDRFVLAEAFTARAPGQAGAFLEFRNWWMAFLRRNKPGFVAIEEPLRSDMTRTQVAYRPNDAFGKSVVKTQAPLTNMQTLLGLYGVRAHAIEVCAELGIEFTEVNNQDWRQVIHGRRTAPKGTSNSSEWWKQAALSRCQQMGWPVPSKDAAEAALIAEWLRIQMSPISRAASKQDLFAGAI